ncbi:hypothetical protein Dimus_007377 [Dionaea muscipula]
MSSRLISSSSDHHHQPHHHHHHHHKRTNYLSSVFRQDKSDNLGILAFETAKAMSRLVSLYRSLIDEEVDRLRKRVIKSRGVLYLNSEDEVFLLTLACAERLEDLDRAANAVAGLGLRCSDSGLNQLDQVYRDLKLGYLDVDKLINQTTNKDMDKVVDKMEKLIATTSNLYSELQALSELENSERRIIEWKKLNANSSDANFDLFDQKIAGQRKQVRHLKEASLWSQSFDKSVTMMARVVYYVYAKICHHFGGCISVSVLPHIPTSSKDHHNNNNNNKPKPRKCPTHHIHPQKQKIKTTSRSGPINIVSMPKVPLMRFLSRESRIFTGDDDQMDDFEAILFGINNNNKELSSGSQAQSHVKLQQQHYCSKNNKVFQAAPPSTVGGSGLAQRYANVIILVEKYMKAESVIGEQARENLYNMLPTSLRTFVKSKLRNAWKEMEMEEDRCGTGGEMALAEGWREAVEGIMEWLGPIAHDTLAWQMERNLEKQGFDAKPTVLLMQTLHYSDLVKTEAAIAEVLVGLSCILWHEQRISEDSD